MRITRSAVVVVVAAAALSGSFVPSQTLAEAHSATRPTQQTTTTSQISLDAVTAQAANEAGLVQVCLAGLHDADAHARYAATAAAHPAIAAQIGPDCAIEGVA
jgi:hypothetical protein